MHGSGGWNVEVTKLEPPLVFLEHEGHINSPLNPRSDSICIKYALLVRASGLNTTLKIPGVN